MGQISPKSGIVIFQEKHGNYVYDIAASGGWERVCMAVVLRRFNEGSFYRIPADEPPSPPEPRTVSTPEEAEKLAQEWKLYQYESDYYKSDSKHWKLLQRALEGDFWAATRLIEARGANEYLTWEQEQRYKNDSEFLRKRRKESGYQYETYIVHDLDQVPPESPRYLINSQEACERLAADIMAIMDHTLDLEDSVSTPVLENAIAAATEITTDPHHKVVPPSDPCSLGCGWDSLRYGMIRMARLLLKDRNNWYYQDEARFRAYQVVGKDKFVSTLAKQRVQKLGSAEAVGRKRHEHYIEYATKKNAEEEAEYRGLSVEQRIQQFVKSTEAWLDNQPHGWFGLGHF